MRPYLISTFVQLINESSLTAAAERHPLRFKHQQPKRITVPDAVWINKPKANDENLTSEETV
jgi:hypothetical protein